MMYEGMCTIICILSLNVWKSAWVGQTGRKKVEWLNKQHMYLSKSPALLDTALTEDPSLLKVDANMNNKQQKVIDARNKNWLFFCLLSLKIINK